MITYNQLHLNFIGSTDRASSQQLQMSFSEHFFAPKLAAQFVTPIVSAYTLKIVEKDPFLRLQMRAKEEFNHHQLFSTNKQYLKIKLMQNETNRWSTFW